VSLHALVGLIIDRPHIDDVLEVGEGTFDFFALVSLLAREVDGMLEEAKHAVVVGPVIRHHGAVADKTMRLSPKRCSKIAQNIRDGFGIAPIALEHMMSDRPAVNQNQTNQHLPLTVKAAHMKLSHSRIPFVRVYFRETQELVFDAHDKAFQFYGGMCRRGIYHNMKTAVEAIFVGTARRYNWRFLQMCLHHLIEPVACTPASGWEKGQVENQVGNLRDQMFRPKPRVKSLTELNAWLEDQCKPSGCRPDGAGALPCRTHRRGGRRASAPLPAQIIYDPWHYLPVLTKKPGALRNGPPFKNWDLPPALTQVRAKLKQHADRNRQFVKVLGAVLDHGLAAVEAAGCGSTGGGHRERRCDPDRAGAPAAPADHAFSVLGSKSLVRGAKVVAVRAGGLWRG
jgi:hypothetical protein